MGLVVSLLFPLARSWDSGQPMKRRFNGDVYAYLVVVSPPNQGWLQS